MLVQEIIKKKRDGSPLSAAEIRFTIAGCVQGTIPDYQLSALLMAILLKGMDGEETATLVDAMTHSGAVIDLRDVPGAKIDKHSTGGVGDKVSLVLAPLVASLGVKVPMISGRGLGHTGGTLDKLESIPGFTIHQSLDAFKQIVRDVGCAIIGPTAELAPADQRLYELRDVTGTVESPPLIAASILSKKFAAGIDGLVMDIKVGSGAFRKSIAEATVLAELILEIGKAAGKPMVALLSDMNQPLGHAVGNALEVEEVVAALKGQGPADLMEVTLELGYHMLKLANLASDRRRSLEMLQDAISSGKALTKFAEMIRAQGGDSLVLEDLQRLSQAAHHAVVAAPQQGYIASMDTEGLGMAALMLGAGRQRKEESIDPSVGLKIEKKLGDAVQPGEPLVELYYNDKAVSSEIVTLVERCFVIALEPVQPPPLIIKTLY